MKQNQNSQKIFSGNELNALKDFVKDAENRGDIKKVSPAEIANLTKEVMRVDKTKPQSNMTSTSTVNPNSNIYNIDSNVKLYEQKPEVTTESKSSDVQQQEKESSMVSINKDDGQNEFYFSNSMKQKIENDERDILNRIGSIDQKEIYSVDSPKPNSNTFNNNSNNNQPQSKVEVKQPNKPSTSISTSTSTNSQPQNQIFSNDQKDWDGNINFGSLEDKQKMFEPKNDNQIKTPFPPSK